MRILGTFTTKDFRPTTVVPVPTIATALPAGISTMEKLYSGAVSGHSATLFTAAFDPSLGVGTYIALECFEGELDGRKGSMNFVHSASTKGRDRANEFFSIVEGSGTGALKGIRGTGGMRIDDDGTHRIWFDIEGID